MSIHWLNTNANPRLPGWTEHHGWKMHAVEAPADAKLEDVKRSRALCGQRAKYGWYVDLFMLEDWSQCYCERCKKIYDRMIAGNWVAS